MKRILQLTDTIEKRNGRMSVVMNIYRKINRKKYQFDFLVTDYGHENYLNEIKKLGGHVYFVPSEELTLKKVKSTFLKVISLRKYDYVHYHALSKWGECISDAKSHDIKVIVHSHATRLSDSFIKSLRNRFFSLNIFTCADERVAVSPEAGKKLFLWQNFKYIPNMINYSSYAYNNEDRKLIRQKYGVRNDEKVIGIVGRIAKQKNQIFALKALENLLKEKVNVKLMLVGDYGSREKLYYQSIKGYIDKNHLNEHVIFTGLVNNPARYYSAFDILWLPSFYEGMPTVGIEAQANGLPVVVSNAITKSMKVINNIRYIPTKNKEDLWTTATLQMFAKDRDLNAIDKFEHSLFNESTVVSEWEKLYIK